MKLRSIFADRTGQEIAEAALVLPLVFLILLGIFWFGRAYNVAATITHAAETGARLAASQSSASSGNTSYAGNAQPVVDAISQALLAAKLDPNLAQTVQPPYCPCGVTCDNKQCANVGGSPSANFCIQFNVQLDSSGNNNGSCGVAVSFQYPYQISVPFLNLQTLNLKAQVPMKGEN